MCNSNCPYMTSIEDRNCGTNYPACTAGANIAKSLKDIVP